MYMRDRGVLVRGSVSFARLLIERSPKVLSTIFLEDSGVVKI